MTWWNPHNIYLATLTDTTSPAAQSVRHVYQEELGRQPTPTELQDVLWRSGAYAVYEKEGYRPREPIDSEQDLRNELSGTPAPPAGSPLPKFGVNANGFTSGGTNILPVFAHHGDGLWLHRTKRPESDHQLAAIKAAGYHGVRTFFTKGWYDQFWAGHECPPLTFTGRSGRTVQKWPDYFGDVGRYLISLRQHGLWTEIALGDLQMFNSLSARIQFARDLGRMIKDSGLSDVIAFVQVNEAWQNGVTTPGECQQIVEACAIKIGCLRSGSTTVEPGQEIASNINAWCGSWASHWVVHGMRQHTPLSTTGYPPDTLVRHIFSIGYEAANNAASEPLVNAYGWQTEPIGDGASGAPTSAATNVECLAMMAIQAACQKQAWTFMSGDGVKWAKPIATRAGFIEVPRAVNRIMPLDINTYQKRIHGGSRWTGQRAFEATGHLRADHVMHDDGRLVVLLYGPPSSSMSFPVERGVTGNLWHPGRGDSVPVTKSAGQVLTFGATVGRVFVGRLA